MADYEIDSSDDAIAIRLTNVGDRQTELLDAFGECQEGRCSCRTYQYEKVATMAVTPGPDRIEIGLRPNLGPRDDDPRGPPSYDRIGRAGPSRGWAGRLLDT